MGITSRTQLQSGGQASAIKIDETRFSGAYVLQAGNNGFTLSLSKGGDIFQVTPERASLETIVTLQVKDSEKLDYEDTKFVEIEVRSTLHFLYYFALPIFVILLKLRRMHPQITASDPQSYSAVNPALYVGSHVAFKWQVRCMNNLRKAFRKNLKVQSNM